MYSPYSINRFLFIMEKQLVSCEGDTENLKAKIRFVPRKVHKLTFSDFCCIIHGHVRKFCAVNKVFQFSGKSQLHSASATELLYTVLCGSVSKNEIVHWTNKPVRYPIVMQNMQKSCPSFASTRVTVSLHETSLEQTALNGKIKAWKQWNLLVIT